MSLIDEYAQSLGSLTGTPFQEEVCARLQTVILDFQNIPGKPHGDAGLDGFSHGGKRGYCCYGPELGAFRTNKQRETAIVEKFKGDLRRIFELDFEKRKLICIDNKEMCTILPDGQKLEHITLLVNWFESHRVLGPILTAFKEYKQTSACRYVLTGASLVVWGPKDMANQYAIDASTMLRAEHRLAAQRIHQAATAVAIDNPEDFEQKMAILREIRPDQLAAIESLSDELRKNWRMALAFERELDQSVPTLHHTLEADRSRILRRVSEFMLSSPQPWTQLGGASAIAAEILEKDFGKLYGALVQDVSSGEIARLVGECPIGWEKPKVTVNA
jgi:hypothetical protein